MSKHDKIAKLKEYIKNFVIKELEKDEEIDEASTTASAGAANPMGTGIYYDTPYAFRSKKKKDKEKMKKITRAGGYKPVNESQPFADFTQFPKLSRDQQESLDELFGFAESYQIYNAFEKDPKKFIKTLDDMANIRKASNKKPKGVNFNKGKKQFVKEGKKRFRQRHGIGRAKYTVSSHDGKSKHKDGSDFFDIAIFKNKKDLAKKINDLTKKGYIYSYKEGVNEDDMVFDPKTKSFKIN